MLEQKRLRTNDGISSFFLKIVLLIILINSRLGILLIFIKEDTKNN